MWCRSMRDSRPNSGYRRISCPSTLNWITEMALCMRMFSSASPPSAAPAPFNMKQAQGSSP